MLTFLYTGLFLKQKNMRKIKTRRDYRRDCTAGVFCLMAVFINVTAWLLLIVYELWQKRVFREESYDRHELLDCCLAVFAGSIINTLFLVCLMNS